MSSLILAAGNQTRWNLGNYPGLPDIKQLLVIDGEVLIRKIQRQFPGSIVVTKNQAIKKHSLKWFEPENNEVTIATLFSTRDLWEDWTTVLLGDVLYGQDTIEKINSQKEGLMFYGDKEEIYGFKFNLAMSPGILLAINRIVISPHFEHKFGKLWNLIRTLNGSDFRIDKVTRYFTTVSDCADFDTKKGFTKYAKNKRLSTPYSSILQEKHD